MTPIRIQATSKLSRHRFADRNRFSPGFLWIVLRLSLACRYVHCLYQDYIRNDTYTSRIYG